MPRRVDTQADSIFFVTVLATRATAAAASNSESESANHCGTVGREARRPRATRPSRPRQPLQPLPAEARNLNLKPRRRAGLRGRSLAAAGRQAAA